MNNLVSVVIPVYNQPDLLDECLKSIALQRFSDFRVIIVDDASTVDYQQVISKYKDMTIEYRRNNRNKGAMFNMKSLLEIKWMTKYFVVFHEDDLMHPLFLEQQVKVMEENNLLSFSGTLMEYFTENEFYTFYSKKKMQKDNHTYFNSASDFLKTVLLKQEICFGSIIYRTNNCDNINFEVHRFGPLCDRPYLISFLKNGTLGCLINNSLVYYRDHGPDDQRFSHLTGKQIVSFFKSYKNVLKTNVSLKKLYLNYATNEILNFCSISKKVNYIQSLLIFIYALFNSMASIKYMGPKAFRALNIYNFILRLKKIKSLFE